MHATPLCQLRQPSRNPVYDCHDHFPSLSVLIHVLSREVLPVYASCPPAASDSAILCMYTSIHAVYYHSTTAFFELLHVLHVGDPRNARRVLEARTSMTHGRDTEMHP